MPEKLVNKSGVPELFFKAAQIDRHVTAGDISVTQLIDAPQIRYLKKTEDYEFDVKNNLWMLFGTAVHHLPERAEVSHFSARYLIDAAQVLDDMKDPQAGKAADWMRNLAREKWPEAFDDSIMVESTLSLPVNIDTDTITISGTVDKFETETGTLKDYKTASVYSYIYKESREKWYAQQNVYAYMLRELGYEVNSAKIIAFFKDWSRTGMLRSKDYPPSLAMEIDVPLLDHEVVGKYIKKRLHMHVQVFDKPGSIPCSGKEMWATADTYKVKKKNGKRSMKNFDNKALAQKFVDDNAMKHAGGLNIEFTPGKRRRCEEFCPVAEVCPQKQAYDAKMKELEENGK